MVGVSVDVDVGFTNDMRWILCTGGVWSFCALLWTDRWRFMDSVGMGRHICIGGLGLVSLFSVTLVAMNH